MTKSISAAEANRNFSRLLRAVRDGESFVVTSHGTPVASLSPIDRQPAALATARRRFLARLEARPIQILNVKKWTRDELYERGPDGEPKRARRARHKSARL